MDNGPRQGLDKFLKAASDDPDTVLHYEFMQDYKVLCQKCFFESNTNYTYVVVQKYYIDCLCIFQEL